eukprot:COSAG01_NODE_6185_length_3804_cov_2.702564_2_plen_142_part_00
MPRSSRARVTHTYQGEKARCTQWAPTSRSVVSIFASPVSPLGLSRTASSSRKGGLDREGLLALGPLGADRSNIHSTGERQLQLEGQAAAARGTQPVAPGHARAHTYSYIRIEGGGGLLGRSSWGTAVSPRPQTISRDKNRT